jgi:glucose/arabinose dehydrogenase
MGLHGCWNCSVVHGYKAVFMQLRADNGFEDAIDLVTGFFPPDGDPMMDDQAWGRPVDVIPNQAGNLYISDDRAGAVYELYRK